MDTNEMKRRILEDAKKAGMELSEDQLNAMVLEASQMDSDKLDRLSGGGILFNCDNQYWCLRNNVTVGDIPIIF